MPSSASPYEILQLRPDASQELTSEDVKAAYHRALLLHHPDKLKSPSVTSGVLQRNHNSLYSIDEIIHAYQTLVDPAKRAAYDENLKCIKSRGLRATTEIANGTHPGVETYDLEELNFDEQSSRWSRECRCGDEQGYVVAEAELERESEGGNSEIYAGCKGCSLFVKVLFGIAGEELDGHSVMD